MYPSFLGEVTNCVCIRMYTSAREDAPLVNAQQLALLLPETMRHDQRAAVHTSAAKKRGSIASFLEKGHPHKVCLLQFRIVT